MCIYTHIHIHASMYVSMETYSAKQLWTYMIVYRHMYVCTHFRFYLNRRVNQGASCRRCAFALPCQSSTGKSLQGRDLFNVGNLCFAGHPGVREGKIQGKRLRKGQDSSSRYQSLRLKGGAGSRCHMVQNVVGAWGGNSS